MARALGQAGRAPKQRRSVGGVNVGAAAAAAVEEVVDDEGGGEAEGEGEGGRTPPPPAAAVPAPQVAPGTFAVMQRQHQQQLELMQLQQRAQQESQQALLERFVAIQTQQATAGAERGAHKRGMGAVRARAQAAGAGGSFLRKEARRYATLLIYQKSRHRPEIAP